MENAEAVEPWARVASLSEPARGAFVFFQAAGGSLDGLARLLDLPDAGALALPLAQARHALAPEQYFPGDSLVPLHRPWGGDSAEVGQAVAGVDAKTAPQLAAQVAFDRQWHEAVESIVLPEELQTLDFRGLEAAVPTGLRAILRQPAVMAIGVAFAVMMGVGIFAAMQKMDEFPGKELINALVEDADGQGDSKLEGIETTEAGRLGDWFLLKGFENFSVPPEFEHVKAVGCRAYKFEGRPVAQIALDPRNALLFVFRSSEIDSRLNSPNWLIYQQEDWAVAVRSEGEICYVVTFMGDADDMPEFLRTVGR